MRRIRVRLIAILLIASNAHQTGATARFGIKKGLKRLAAFLISPEQSILQNAGTSAPLNLVSMKLFTSADW